MVNLALVHLWSKRTWSTNISFGALICGVHIVLAASLSCSLRDIAFQRHRPCVDLAVIVVSRLPRALWVWRILLWRARLVWMVCTHPPPLKIYHHISPHLSILFVSLLTAVFRLCESFWVVRSTDACFVQTVRPHPPPPLPNPKFFATLHHTSLSFSFHR